MKECENVNMVSMCDSDVVTGISSISSRPSKTQRGGRIWVKKKVKIKRAKRLRTKDMMLGNTHTQLRGRCRERRKLHKGNE